MEQPDKQNSVALSKFNDFWEVWFKLKLRNFLTKIGLGILLGFVWFGIRWAIDQPQPFDDIKKTFQDHDLKVIGYVWVVIWGLVEVYVGFLKDRGDKKERALADEALRRQKEIADQAVALQRRESLCLSQKERIRILEGFEPPTDAKIFHDDRSIYTSIIQTLSQLKELKPQIEASKQKHNVCLLLCSPALDYFRSEYKDIAVFKAKWGDEFLNLLKDVLSCPYFHFDVCHLPLESQTGINAMHDFLSGLANYLADSSETFNNRLDALHDRTENFIKHMEVWTRDKTAENRFHHRQHLIDIPFQIVLINGPKIKEVVVSFAGREILEREPIETAEKKLGDTSDIKGFFSSDPQVVETFHRIYLDYASPANRAPYVPSHTQGIIHKHLKQLPHQINNYLDAKFNLDVGEGCFSPAIGNSTKFTAWVISKVLTKEDDTVLDIGSGTGVLALMALKTLERLETKTARILAVEGDERAFQTLKKNCQPYPQVETVNWSLEEDSKSGGKFIDVSAGKAVVTSDQIKAPFKVIIADLPFVDVNNEDKRFFDPDHKAHARLFSAINKNSNWLASDGKLITAFSSLGGPDDVMHFERTIAEHNLRVVQRIDFHEDHYIWIVHVIVKKDKFKCDSYWWDELQARNTISLKKNATTS